MLDLGHSKEVYEVLNETKNGRIVNMIRFGSAVDIVTKCEESSLLDKLTTNQANNIRMKMRHGTKRISPDIVEWLRDRDPDFVQLWEADKLIRSKAVCGADRVAALMARRSDIGEIPDVDQEAIIASIKADPAAALSRYFPNWFTRPFGPMTKRAIEVEWNIIIHGGKQAIGLIRGGGKTTITKGLCILALFCGLRRYMVIFAANADAADNIMRDIIFQLETNMALLQDFPAACIPIRALQGRSQRTRSQSYKGAATHIEYGSKKIKLAQIPDAACSGAKLCCFGIDSGFLGLVDDGMRPDLILLDDIQSLEAAKSDKAIRDLIKAIEQGISGLGGVDVATACINLVTCTREGDFPDQMLDHDLHPEFSGLRMRLIECWGTGGDDQEEAWQEYCRLWKIDQKSGNKTNTNATAYYFANREIMDKGVTTNDDEFYIKGDELSTIQHAWNKRLEMKDEAYFAQMENHPLKSLSTQYQIKPTDVVKNINGLPRCTAPTWATDLFFASDVGLDKLRWGVAAFGSGMRSAIVDYGVWPPTGRVCKANQTKQVEKMAVNKAMRELKQHIEGKVYRKGISDTPQRITAGCFDRGFDADTVQFFCMTETHGCKFPLVPMIGRSDKWNDSPKNAIKKAWNAIMVKTTEGAAPGEFIFSRVDYIKELVQRSFLCDSWQSPGSCSLFGHDPASHLEFGDSICAEVLADKGRGERGTEWWKWNLRPGAQNHFFDVTVMLYALACFWGAMKPDDEFDAMTQSADMTGMLKGNKTPQELSQTLRNMTRKIFGGEQRVSSVRFED